MKKNNWILSGVIILVLAAGIFNMPILWAASIISVVVFSEWRSHKMKTLVEYKEKVMGNRVIEGMKALSELCGNAYDHIKDNKLKLDKLNAKLGEHTAKLHRIDQQKHRMDSRGAAQRNDQKRFKEVDGISGQSESPKKNFERAPRRNKEYPVDVQETTNKPTKHNG